LLEKNNIGWAFWPYKKMEKDSAVVTITPPEGWDKIVAFAKLPRGLGQCGGTIEGEAGSGDHRQGLLPGCSKIFSCSIAMQTRDI